MQNAEWMMSLSFGKPNFITHHSSLITHHFIAAALCAAMMGGCGTTTKRDPAASKAPPAPRGGGYYLDDGPGANPPANLDSIPDAVPRREPLHRGASRPYSVMGRDYTPMGALGQYRARGIATWYGRRYHGKATSIGEPYDMYAMSAAHTTLPIPSYARVTHLASGKTVVVRINDRGPFVGDRLIDLSYAAAHRLGVVGAGSAMVQVESIIPGVAPPVLAETPASPLREPVREAAAAVAPAPATEPASVPMTPAPEVPILSDASGVYLQLGAFGSKDNAENFLARLMLQVDWLTGRLEVFARDGLYRVRAGPYASAVEARRIAERVSETLGIKPVVLTR